MLDRRDPLRNGIKGEPEQLQPGGWSLAKPGGFLVSVANLFRLVAELVRQLPRVKSVESGSWGGRDHSYPDDFSEPWNKQ